MRPPEGESVGKRRRGLARQGPGGGGLGPVDILSQDDYGLLGDLPAPAKVLSITTTVMASFDEEAMRAALTVAAMLDPVAFDEAAHGTQRATTHTRRLNKVASLRTSLDCATERVEEGAGGDKAGGDGDKAVHDGDKAGGDGDTAAGDGDKVGDGEEQYKATLTWRGTPEGEVHTLVISVEPDLMVKCPGCGHMVEPSKSKAACPRAFMRHMVLCSKCKRMSVMPPSLLPAWKMKLSSEDKPSAPAEKKKPTEGAPATETKRKVMAHPVNAFFDACKKRKTTKK